MTSDETLAPLNQFLTDVSPDGVVSYEFAGKKSHHPHPETAKEKTREILAWRAAGEVCSIYLPAWLFGPLALKPGPCRVLQALTRELTRRRGGGRADRADRAEVIGGAAHEALDPTMRYVGFNGNAGRRRPQFHGRGYSLGGWMRRAGDPGDPASLSFRADARQFLADLKSLLEPFGLVAAARVPGLDGWRGLDEAVEEVDVVLPNRMARKCLIQVYGPEDYLDRWRAHFAAALGFGSIPRGGAGEAEPAAAGVAVATAEQLARWMKSRGLTDTQLAGLLGVSRTLVCKYRSGSRPLSDRFVAKLDGLFGDSSGGCGGRV